MLIYIMPSGWDKDLVVKTAFKSGADKICLISAKHKKQHIYSITDKITQNKNKSIRKELSKFVEIDSLEVNYIDLNDIILQVNEYLNKNKENKFKMNISTGSRLLSATLLVVAYLNNIEVDYSIAKNHNPKIMDLIEKGEDYHQGLSEIISVPSLPFKLNFSKKEEKFIRTVKEKNTLSVKDYIKGAKGNDENRLRSEFNYLANKLSSQGILILKIKDKKSFLELSDLGKILIHDSFSQHSFL